MSSSFRACDQCRKSKTKCSGESPCDHCGRHGRTCVFSPPKKRGPQIKPRQHPVANNQRTLSQPKKQRKVESNSPETSPGQQHQQQQHFPQQNNSIPQQQQQQQQQLLQHFQQHTSNANTINFKVNFSPSASSVASHGMNEMNMNTNPDIININPRIFEKSQVSGTSSFPLHSQQETTYTVQSVQPAQPIQPVSSIPQQNYQSPGFAHYPNFENSHSPLNYIPSTSFQASYPNSQDYLGSSSRSPSVLGYSVGDFSNPPTPSNTSFTFSGLPSFVEPNHNHTPLSNMVFGSKTSISKFINVGGNQHQQQKARLASEQPQIFQHSFNGNLYDSGEFSGSSLLEIEEQTPIVPYNKRENSLAFTQITLKYCDLLKRSAATFFQKEASSMTEMLNVLFSFSKLDGRVAAIVAAISRQSTEDKRLSDRFLEYAMKECHPHLTKCSKKIDKQVESALSICCLSIAFAGIDQLKYRYYSSIGRRLLESILCETSDNKHWCIIPFVLQLIGDAKKPNRLLILEIIADYKLITQDEKSMETDNKIIELEEEMLKSELYTPPEQLEGEYTELWERINYLQKLFFVKRVLISYSNSLWNIYHSENVTDHDAVIELDCIPYSVGIYLLGFINQALSSEYSWPLTFVGTELSANFLKFFIYQALGDQGSSLTEARNCIEELSTSISPVLLPGLGLIPSLFMVARFFIVNSLRTETIKSMTMMNHWAKGYPHARIFILILEGIMHDSGFSFSSTQESDNEIIHSVAFPSLFSLC